MNHWSGNLECPYCGIQEPRFRRNGTIPACASSCGIFLSDEEYGEIAEKALAYEVSATFPLNAGHRYGIAVPPKTTLGIPVPYENKPLSRPRLREAAIVPEVLCGRYRKLQPL